MEISADKKRKPIPGANDGASGVAALIEVARQLKASGVSVGVQFVLFDGEDYGPGIQDMFLGAKYYAKNPVLGKPEYAILIDMIGDKDLQIGREFNSDRAAKDINDRVFGVAAKLGIKEFIDAPGHEIMDDHLELQRIGWKAIDLIDEAAAKIKIEINGNGWDLLRKYFNFNDSIKFNFNNNFKAH